MTAVAIVGGATDAPTLAGSAGSFSIRPQCTHFTTDGLISPPQCRRVFMFGVSTGAPGA
jgi:hypothetical protein